MDWCPKITVRVVCLKLFPIILKYRDIQCLAFLYIKRSFTICIYNLISCFGVSAQIRPRPPPFEVLSFLFNFNCAFTIYSYLGTEY
jgi:hypothetical protein